MHGLRVIIPMDEEVAIDAIGEAIVGAVHPEMIVVFGSHARGEAGPDSDLDLLIVERESFAHRSRRNEVAKIRRALAGFAVAKDILVFGPFELRRWRNTANHVIARALREGNVLYERH